MKLFTHILPTLFIVMMINGCTNSALLNANSLSIQDGINPLQTEKDIQLEKILASGEWAYKHQDDDCDDTNWKQLFYTNNYYKSVGSACSIKDAFSVDAERWYIKNQYLYIVNLSPEADNDIILRYNVVYLDNKKLTLSSNGYNYTFKNVVVSR